MDQEVFELQEALLSWQQSVDQAVQDIRLLVDAANDLYRAASDAERAVAAVQYHQFDGETDAGDLIRTGSHLKFEVGAKVASIRDHINATARDIADIGDIAYQAQSSV